MIKRGDNHRRAMACTLAATITMTLLAAAPAIGQTRMTRAIERRSDAKRRQIVAARQLRDYMVELRHRVLDAPRRRELLDEAAEMRDELDYRRALLAERIKSDPSYQRAIRRNEQLAERLARIQQAPDTGDPDLDRRIEYAQATLASRMLVRHFAEQDPEIQNLRTAYEFTVDELGSAQAAAREAIANDPHLRNLRETLSSASDQVRAAHAAVVAARDSASTTRRRPTIPVGVTRSGSGDSGSGFGSTRVIRR